MALPKLPKGDEKPKNLKESIFMATPIVLTVIATVLAGLSSGEMTRAQYYRSLAAQTQAKASDQWNYFQAKKLRSVDAQNTLDVLAASARPRRLDLDAVLNASGSLAKTIQQIQSSASTDRIKQLNSQIADIDTQLHQLASSADAVAPFADIDVKPPAIDEKPIASPDIVEAMKEINDGKLEADMAPLLRRIGVRAMNDAFTVADENLKTFDAAMDPAKTALDNLHLAAGNLGEIAQDFRRSAPGDAAAAAQSLVAAIQSDITAARLRYNVVRYDRESKYNGVTAQLFEIQVRQNGVISERDRNRSTNFFYGMLAAQLGVTIATFSLAMQKRSLFWSLATIAGAGAITFSGYVYMFT